MNIEEKNKSKIFAVITPFLKQQSDKLYIIRLLDWIYRTKNPTADFLTKNVNKVHWDLVIIAIHLMDQFTTQLFFPLFYIFEYQIREKELNKYFHLVDSVVDHSLENFVLSKQNKESIDRLIIENNKKIFEKYFLQKNHAVKNKLKFAKHVIKIDRTISYDLKDELNLLPNFKLNLIYHGCSFLRRLVNFIALSELIRENTEYTTHELLTLFQIRNILYHSQSIFLINKKSSDMIKEFLEKDLHKVLSEYRFSLMIKALSNHFSQLKQEIHVDTNDLKAQNTNFIIDKILVFYVEQFIPKKFLEIKSN